MADAEHGPWPLHRAWLLRLDQNLIQAAGLPEPEGSPLLYAAPGVPVRIGRWHWLTSVDRRRVRAAPSPRAEPARRDGR
jgi:Uncharacterized conserved protein (COG2071)